MLEINGLKYSKERFNDYKARVIVEITKASEEYRFDVYTTDLVKESIENVLLGRITEGITSLEIVHFATRQYDDACTKLVNEWLSKEETNKKK